MPGYWVILGKLRSIPKTRRLPFDYLLHYRELNLREQSELYRVGVGEMGVLLVRPYKDEILPHWRFKTPDVARESADKIHQLFLDYKAADDFIGMDMARKFLQMGMTRSLRCYHHKSGQKYISTSLQIRANA